MDIPNEEIYYYQWKKQKLASNKYPQKSSVLDT